MWVVFRKSDREVVGSSVDAGAGLGKEEALKEVVDGLIGSPSIGDFDAVEVKDREKLPGLTRAVGEGRARVRDLAGGKVDVVDDTPEAVTIQVTTNAEQLHPVDSVPLIPADGRSFLVVNLQKVNDRGEVLVRKTVDTEVIWLRINHGTLRDNTEDPQSIRSVKLVSGAASFRVYSGTERRLATVQMLSANPELRLGGLQIEFI